MADSHGFGGAGRGPTFPRQPEELHIPSANSSLPSNGPRPAQHQFPAPPEYAANHPPTTVGIQASASQPQPQSHPQYSASTGQTNPGNVLPGALQPGNASRSGPISSNTAPTLPTISQQPPASSPSRPALATQPHSYSASSPAAFDQQKYKPFGGSSDGSKYISPTLATYSQGNQYSPLGLADIRSRMDHGMMEDMSGAGQPNNADPPISTNCNYMAPWSVYALDWCKWSVPPGTPTAGKVAIGSYLEDNHNYIQILGAQYTPPDRDYPEPDGLPGLEFVKIAEATHSYPVTRILWEPPSSQKQSTDLLATSGDHLRLWSLPSESSQFRHHGSSSINRSTNARPPVQKLSPLALLSNSKSPEHTAPITSLDWNAVSPSLIITSSIDTTCTIWDIPTLTAKTQLIAHDREVYDVRFCANSVDVFVSCGADGSVRMFDLRSLEHSTIIYEPSEKNDKLANPGNLSPSSYPSVWPPPLLRIAASPHDAHLLATFSQDSSVIRILDVRQPGQALLELKGHSAPINCVEWCPARRGTLASGADDSLVLIWDLINQNNAAAISSQTPVGQPHHNSSSGASTMERGPAAAWQCDYEVSNVSWAPHAPSGNVSGWLGVSGGKGLWGVSI
ncbi:WD repeat protein [Coccidioides immitis RS]|uniref:WD repeat protein n=2 Tax=Coccidioides immitis TaxID=5501 RepID=J3K6C9_COCIM|nr:WD repeat protein [Coccidioides immitis RS]EAS30112.3 WD repeat protein [Coccidioides immitis RS]KMP07061.1 hypothetical protein CIRG_06742 [Coccidioides immitis RMSCC 2394]TPX22122.1 hypothetical protein DIZ76_013987 [Coccidioides immitis]